MDRAAWLLGYSLWLWNILLDNEWTLADRYPQADRERERLRD